MSTGLNFAELWGADFFGIHLQAPEVIKRLGTDKAADYWAIGVLIYEMLVGEPPFSSSTGDPWDTFRKVQQGRVVVPAHVSPEATDLIFKLLHVGPLMRSDPRLDIRAQYPHLMSLLDCLLGAACMQVAHIAVLQSQRVQICHLALEPLPFVTIPCKVTNPCKGKNGGMNSLRLLRPERQPWQPPGTVKSGLSLLYRLRPANAWARAAAVQRPSRHILGFSSMWTGPALKLAPPRHPSPPPSTAPRTPPILTLSTAWRPNRCQAGQSQKRMMPSGVTFGRGWMILRSPSESIACPSSWSRNPQPGPAA